MSRGRDLESLSSVACMGIPLPLMVRSRICSLIGLTLRILGGDRFGARRGGGVGQREDVMEQHRLRSSAEPSAHDPRAIDTDGTIATRFMDSISHRLVPHNWANVPHAGDADGLHLGFRGRHRGGSGTARHPRIGIRTGLPSSVLGGAVQAQRSAAGGDRGRPRRSASAATVVRLRISVVAAGGIRCWISARIASCAGSSSLCFLSSEIRERSMVGGHLLAGCLEGELLRLPGWG